MVCSLFSASAIPAAEDSAPTKGTGSLKVPGPLRDPVPSASSTKKDGEKEGAGTASGGEDKDEGPSFITLKVMVVNPSNKFKQIYPMKAYLPEEVKEGHILDREDLTVGYDEVKKAYFLTKELELEPGQSVVKTVKVEDVWFILPEKLEALSEDAHDLYQKLSSTPYAEQGRLLMNNIEVLLMQIMERQSDKTVTPQEHISIFRDNKKRVTDIEMDLMSLRRFLSAASEGQSFFGFKKSAAKGKMPKILEDMAKRNASGTVSAQVLWRVIFSILIFIGLSTFLFLSVWQNQIRKIFSKARHQAITPAGNQKESDSMKIGDFYPGLREDLPKEGPVEEPPNRH